MPGSLFSLSELLLLRAQWGANRQYGARPARSNLSACGCSMPPRSTWDESEMPGGARHWSRTALPDRPLFKCLAPRVSCLSSSPPHVRWNGTYIRRKLSQHTPSHTLTRAHRYSTQRPREREGWGGGGGQSNLAIHSHTTQVSRAHTISLTHNR